MLLEAYKGASDIPENQPSSSSRPACHTGINTVKTLHYALLNAGADTSKNDARVQALLRIPQGKGSSSRSCNPCCNMQQRLTWMIVLPTCSTAPAFLCTSAGELHVEQR